MTEAAQNITEDEAPMRLSSPPASPTRKRPYKARRTSAQVKYDNAVKAAAKERASEAKQSTVAAAGSVAKALDQIEAKLDRIERMTDLPVRSELNNMQVDIDNTPDDPALSKVVTTIQTTVVRYGQPTK